MRLDKVPDVPYRYAVAYKRLHALNVHRDRRGQATFDDGPAGIRIATELFRHEIDAKP
jgi:hypothetical protein